MRILKDLLQNTDFLGDQIGLEHNRSTRFKSITGGLYSLFIFVAASVIGSMFCLELFNRKNPSMLLSKEGISNSEVNQTDFPFLISTNINNVVSDLPFKFFSLDIVSFKISLEGVITRVVNDNALTKCDPFNITFPDSNSTRYLFCDSLNLGTAMCLRDYGQYSFHNKYFNPDSSFINIRFKKCSKVTNPDCPDYIDNSFNIFRDLLHKCIC